MGFRSYQSIVAWAAFLVSIAFVSREYAGVAELQPADLSNVRGGDCYRQMELSQCGGGGVVAESNCYNAICVPKKIDGVVMGWECPPPSGNTPPTPPHVVVAGQSKQLEIKSWYFDSVSSAPPAPGTYTTKHKSEDPLPCQTVYDCKCNEITMFCEQDAEIGDSTAAVFPELVGPTECDYGS